MTEMLAGAMVQGLLNSIGLPTLLTIVLGCMFMCRFLKDTSKPMAALGLLAVGGFALWHLLPSARTDKPGTPGTASVAASPSVQPLPKYRPVEKGKPPLPPRTPAEIHKPSIDDLHAKRLAKAEKERPSFLDPEWRAENLRQAFAKEKERKAALLAKAEQERGFASVPPSPPAYAMTPDQARTHALDLEEQRIIQARALLARVQGRYAPPEQPQELALRAPFGSR